MTRPTWDEYGLAGAKWAAMRGDCTRRRVGALILDEHHRTVETGYNGSHPGGPSCLKGECPRGEHYAVDHCGWPCGKQRCGGCGESWPCDGTVDVGSSYDTGPGACVAVHAEMNALMLADRNRLDGATLYITEPPCDGCRKHIRMTGIRRVVWPGDVWEPHIAVEPPVEKVHYRERIGLGLYRCAADWRPWPCPWVEE